MNRRILVGLVSTLLLAVPGAARAERCSDDSDVEERREKQKKGEPIPEECIERNIYWMPGGFGTVFQPSAGLGAFFGGGVQFAPLLWSHNNDRFGPSQGNTFLQAGILRSPSTGGSLAIFELGGTASFERNSSRRFLIPYFGAALGGLTQSELGTSLYAYPMGGAHVYWHHNVMVDAEAGYHFPFSDVDRAKGPRGQIALRFSLW